MCRRLMASYVLLLAMVLIALEVPFGVTLASRETQRVLADRLEDAIRFASLAEPVLRTGDTADLGFELERYGELYGIEVALVDSDGRIVLTALGWIDLDNSQVLRQSRRALAGRQADESGTVWPWRSTPIVVAVPVGSGGEYYGAIIVVSAVDDTAATITLAWSILAAGGLLVLAIGLAAAWHFARWTLRPVAELDAAVHHIGAGNYSVRVSDHLGPPELRRLAHAFNSMTVIVADLLERQRAFVSHASHQLRNPLTALRLHVEELGYDLSTPEARDGHRLALEESERMGQVLDSLLSLAKADSGRGILEKVDVGERCQRRVEAWHPLAQRRQVWVRYVAPDQPCRANVVSTALDQALDALIDNAVKFGGDGCEVVVRVETADGGPGGWGTEIHVTDTGPGMTAEQRGHATERFWRGPGSTAVEGSGLGLAIVVVLVEASEGCCELLPAVPHGLDVRIWLPTVEPIRWPQALTER
ncbi:MAG: HAMP domain-containing histidine kinase [Dactylosporangium sp.]|nr:HAMP domain-containing histidine kinase [Dactylosporangium sp.]NNJ60267.1 HAMP domain-containing histidine kinase [Dactylosporangium sp.]